MEWFKHPTTARYNEVLKKLEKLYGLAAVGFFWKAVELIKFCEGEVPYGLLLALRSRPLRYVQVIAIIDNPEFFDFDRQESVVRLNKTVEEQLFGKPPKKLSSGARTDTPTEAPTDAPTDAPTEARREAPVPAGPIEVEKEENKNKSESEKKESATHTLIPGIEEERLLNEFLSSKCPVLLEMEEPLTLDQYHNLKRNYQTSDIERVLLDMQNDVNISSNRSCYLTADKWLRYRVENGRRG